MTLFGSPHDDRRLRLIRWNDQGKGVLSFVMLNPSTADDLHNDPTIRRCVGFLKREGKRTLRVVNLFGQRATKPADLLETSIDPESPTTAERAAWRWALVDRVPTVVAAWGAPGPGELGRMVRARAGAFIDFAFACEIPLLCLGTTAEGWPRHPLYVRSDQRLVPWDWMGAEE